MSTISAGTTSTTTLIHSGDTTGSLVLKTNDTGSGGTTAVTIDTSQNVGIGTASPSTRLHTYTASGENKLIVEAGAASQSATLSLQTNNTTPGACNIYMGKTGASTNGQVGYDPNNNFLYLYTNNTERMRIDSSGNVGIGTSSPASRLNIATGASTSCTMRFTANNTGTGAGDRGRLDFYSADNSGTAYQLGYMDYDRADGTGTASYIAWANRVSGTVAERMRIDSSGRLVVGANSSSGGSASDTFIEVRKTGDAFIATQGGSYGTDKQGFVYRRNGTYGAMTFATGGVSTASYSYNQFDDWYWYKWDGSTATSAVRMTIGGAMILRSTLTQNGSPDYAEYFEWSDGNSNAEDRKGKTVVMDGVTGKIRLATSTDPASSIIGVCSRTYGVILDSQELDWADKYLKNEFGELIKEEVEYVEYLESNGNMRSRLLAGEDIPADATNVRYFKSLNNVVNPNFDSNTEYTPRSKRKEWEPIGLVGKLRIIKGQPVGDRWVKMRDISETIEEWLVR